MSASIVLLLAILLPSAGAFAQQDSLVLPEPAVVDLQFLVAEAMMNNQEIQAAFHEMDLQDARVPQAGVLMDPELRVTEDEMPAFDFGRAMSTKILLMQQVPFPPKLIARRHIAQLQSDHAHHAHLETVNDVIARLKSAYYELWYVQQNHVLDLEHRRLMTQFAAIARTRYGTGEVSQQDLLRAQVELSMITNDLIGVRQRELSAKAMLAGALNRRGADTIGYAVIPEEVIFEESLDSLLVQAGRFRPMLIHDSLSIEENSEIYALARQEYLPDFTFGLEYITSPTEGSRGWSLMAGITLPFAPWTIGRAGGRVDEAAAALKKATASFRASRNMVMSTVRDLYYRASAGKEQLTTFRLAILPQARMSLQASQAAYQTGKGDFLMLVDAYRTLVSLTKEYFMTRMIFEQTKAELERAVGTSLYLN